MLPDMLSDPRFAGSQHVAESGLRSYVGTALRLPLPGAHGSVALGSLCAASWKATGPLSARQQRVLVRFADMIVLDIVEHAQKRRTAEQQSMAGRLTAISAIVDAENVNDVVLTALRETYPDAEVGLQHRPDDTIALAGADPVPYAAFVHYMYEDVAAVEADLLAFNHLPAAAHTGARTLRALAIPRSIDPHLYLVVQTGALEHVFDDVDAAFVHSCSLIMCNVQQAAELQRAAAARARFLRGMSHELRTPIHALLSTCELLAEHTRAQGAALAAEPLGAPDSAARRAEHAALLANAMASGHTLLSTINNLLNYDSLESFAAAPAFVALAGVEQVVLDAAVAAILERGAPVRLVAECALPEGVHLVHTDYDLLRQCLGALVSNAVHFTSAGSITFRTSLEHPADGGVPALVYDVIDTGPGVPPADIARIFLPFEKADAHAPGVGLGLTVAAPTARALGGEVSLVASSPNGSHFRLRLAHPTLASQRGHPSRRVARAALPRTFHVAPDAPPLLVDAAGVLLAVGFAAAPLAQAALVLRASPPVGASDAIMAGVAPRQLVLCLHGSEDDAHVARDAVGAEARVVHASAPLYGAHLWPALVKAADVFDALDLAPRWAAPRRAPSPAPPCRAPASSRPRSVPRLLVVDDNVRRRAAAARARADMPPRKRTSPSCACTRAGADMRTRPPPTARRPSRSFARPRPRRTRSRLSWSAARCVSPCARPADACPRRWTSRCPSWMVSRPCGSSARTRPPTRSRRA
jgi:signal transduction histidine kinase